MKVLLLLAAQHAGVDDVFAKLVPKWAFAALFSRIVGREDSDHVLLSSTALQDWLRSEEIIVPARLVLELFTGTMHTEVANKADFISVRTLLLQTNYALRKHIAAYKGARPVMPFPRCQCTQQRQQLARSLAGAPQFQPAVPQHTAPPRVSSRGARATGSAAGAARRCAPGQSGGARRAQGSAPVRRPCRGAAAAAAGAVRGCHRNTGV